MLLDSVEVFYVTAEAAAEPGTCFIDEETGESRGPGWYYWNCSNSGHYDVISDCYGPYDTEAAARADAEEYFGEDEWGDTEEPEDGASDRAPDAPGQASNPCGSCNILYINGTRTHEEGCPDSWKDFPAECFNCGCEFKPESRPNKYSLCPDCQENND
jgi:hypothetical protein